MADSESIPDPALDFCRLCREGRLYEAEAWLKAGKPAQLAHKNIRCTPLGIAIDRGFHSLVRVLLQHGFSRRPNTWPSRCVKVTSGL